MAAVDELFTMTRRAQKARAAMDAAVVRNDTADYHKQLRTTPEVRHLKLLNSTYAQVMAMSRQRKQVEASDRHPDEIAVDSEVYTKTIDALSEATVRWIKEQLSQPAQPQQPSQPPQPPPAAPQSPQPY